MVKPFALLAVAACFLGLLYHRVRRAHPLGAFRCERCGRAFESLEDIGESGRVSPLRDIYSRDGAHGHATVSTEQVS